MYILHVATCLLVCSFISCYLFACLLIDAFPLRNKIQMLFGAKTCTKKKSSEITSPDASALRCRNPGKGSNRSCVSSRGEGSHPAGKTNKQTNKKQCNPTLWVGFWTCLTLMFTQASKQSLVWLRSVQRLILVSLAGFVFSQGKNANAFTG